MAAIALDLQMKPETVKTYVKLARKALKQNEETASVEKAIDKPQ